jgi:hypothetical protein
VSTEVPEGADAIFGYNLRAVRLMVVGAYVKRHASAFAMDSYRSSLLPAELRAVLEGLADDYLAFGERIQMLVFPRCKQEPPSGGDIDKFHSVLAGRSTS